MPCCGVTHVDWLVDGALIRCESEKVCVPSEGCCCCIAFNWPCCGGPIDAHWTLVEKAGKKHYVLPLKEPFPLFMCALPVFWVHVCFFLCIDKAIGMVITHDLDQQTLTAEVREKTAFGAIVESRRTKLTKAYIEDKPGSMFQMRQARIIIQSDDGQAPMTSPLIPVSDDYQFQSLKSLVDQINKTIEQTSPPPAAMMMYNGMGMMPQGVVVAEPVNVPMSNVQIVGNGGGYPGGGAGGYATNQPVAFGYAGGNAPVYHQQPQAPGAYGAPPGQQQPYPGQPYAPQQMQQMQQPPMQMQMQMQYMQQQPQPGQPVQMVMSNNGVPTYIYAAPGAPAPMYAAAPGAHVPNSNVDKNEAQARQPPVYGDASVQAPGAVQMASAPPLSKST